MDENIEKELDFYKSKAEYKIRIFIFLFKILKKINNKLFYFNLSLFPGLVASFFLDISSLSVLLTHFFLWKFYFKKFIDSEEIEKSNMDLKYLINSLSSFLKNKRKI